MRVLGIESSSTTASVAVIEEDKLIAEYTINHTLKHSTTLMPMLDEMLKRVNLEVSDLDLIAVSEGPGSFTGLRIGSATAKGIAHALSLPIASIPTLEVIASTVGIMDKPIGVVLFARAREVYYCEYKIENVRGFMKPVELAPIISLEVEELLERLNAGIDEIVLVGDGIEKFKEEFDSLKTKNMLRIQLLNPLYYQLSAKQVALLGVLRSYDKELMTYYEQKPYYHKKSQAEREYEEKHRND